MDDLELSSQPMDMEIENWDHLRNLDLPNTAEVTPEILIGEEYATLKVALKVIIESPMLWWKHEEEITHLLKNFWSVESVGVHMQARILRSKEDIRAENILNRTA